MLVLPPKVRNAINALTLLPSVGERTATRHALFLTTLSQDEIKSFAEAISDLSSLEKCKECGMFSEGELCLVCGDKIRASSTTLCVVEGISDALAIENGGHFKGLLHVLGGVINPLAGIGPKELRIDSLLSRIERNGIKELILALNPSVEGDATSAFIKQAVERMNTKCSVERIGFGVPIGGSLEFLDPLTISKAFENKRLF